MINSDFVIAVHDTILKETGVGRDGVDINKLEGILGRVLHQIEYNEIDSLFEVAAWYGVAISKGYPFVDGNKRTALAVMLTFLEIQGVSILSKAGLDDLMVDIVESNEPHKIIAEKVAGILFETSDINYL